MAGEAQAGSADSRGAENACFHIQEHTFQDVLHEVRICGQILVMQGSYLIWVGSANASMANLDVAMCSDMDAIPVTSTLLGSGTDGVGRSISQRLALKLKAQVFVSYNLPTSMPHLQDAVEKKLFEQVGMLQLASQVQSI